MAAASPSTDGEQSYAVQTQLLAALLSMGKQLADVKQWQRDLPGRLDLRAAQAGIDELMQGQQASAIRSKRQGVIEADITEPPSKNRLGGSVGFSGVAA